ncbi:MAG: FHA domain-containing protein [Blautia sp.]|nr:FHA domain-containing protein [Blautia sp.]
MAKYSVKTKDRQLIVKVKLSLQEKLNERQLDFYSGKSLRGLLKVRRVKRNTIEYYGPIGISLYERLKKPIGKYEFFFIMEQIVDIVQKLDLNALVISDVLFDIKNVYMNETTRELQFIYLPLGKQRADADILAFMESIIYSAEPMQEEDMAYLSRYVYFIRGLRTFNAEKVEKFIQGEDRSIVNTIKNHNIGQSGFMTDKQADYYDHYERKDPEATGLLNAQPDRMDGEEATGLLNECQETGLLTDMEETGLLTEAADQFPDAALYRGSTEEVILVNKPVFRIGKERNCVDYCVTDNDKVSRNHAEIITRGHRYFVIDLNSRNRTYINEVPLPAQQETEIVGGNRLKLANEEFEFRV